MFSDKFKEFPKNRILFLLAAIGLLLVILVELFIFIPIESEVPTYGILEYEFAWTVTRVITIFSAWGANGINNQIVAIYWDFLFIVGYVSLAFSLIIIVFQRSNKKIQNVGSYIIITPFLTGIFDVIENVFLLIMASNPNSIVTPNVLFASLSATIKFGLLFAGIIYFIGALILLLIQDIKKRKE